MDQNQTEPQSTPKQQVVERVRQAANVLVTVRSNPSVDELAATIGLTLMLNKLGKHATAVFSGAIPSTLEFLKPEETIETNTDSLRDFIVSLDKSKADKLRYKVEENVVKIFITPYRTSITEKDLEFTQGDFNVDVVLALGVSQREELDQAITAHGRILHDATVITVTAGQHESALGAVNWQEPAASSLSEMLVNISEAFQGGLIDAQMATAFLTGIVSETERFSNPKTTPKVMTMAAQLMAAGANQQLIANELQKAEEIPLVEEPPVQQEPAASEQDDGSLSIEHENTAEEPPVEAPEQPEETAGEQPSDQTPSFLPPLPPTEVSESFEPLLTAPELTAEEIAEKKAEIHIDNDGNLMRKEDMPRHRIIEPLKDGEEATQEVPSFQPPDPNQTKPDDEIVDPLRAPEGASESFEQKVASVEPTPGFTPPPELPPMPPLPPEVTAERPEGDTTLLDIEKSVQSPHLAQEIVAGNEHAARSAVENVYSQAAFDPSHTARNDLNALPLGSAPEPTAFDAFRLPEEQPAPQQVSPDYQQPPQDQSVLPPLPMTDPNPPAPQQDNNQNSTSPAPPPVPPPFGIS